MISREKYLADLQCWKDKDVIKVITGVRRCGKSTLMEQWKARLRASGIGAERIIHINLEMMENEPLLEYHALHDAVLSRCTGDAMHYVLLDEVQNVPDFQKAIDSLYVRPNIDLYITGSNAQLLSGTLRGNQDAAVLVLGIRGSAQGRRIANPALVRFPA